MKIIAQSFIIVAWFYCHHSIISIPVLVEKRRAIESVLKTQFGLLIDQFENNPDGVARKLYGISVIDINDLDVATSWAVPALDRAKILAVTLIRRLRQCPDLFEDVCKVLRNVPAIQDASGIESLCFIIITKY